VVAVVAERLRSPHKSVRVEGGIAAGIYRVAVDGLIRIGQRALLARHGHRCAASPSQQRCLIPLILNARGLDIIVVAELLACGACS
jgi:hypothetical protein